MLIRTVAYLTLSAGADKIAVVNGGIIAELGTHEELLAQDGMYADLVRLQLTGHDEGEGAIRLSPSGNNLLAEAAVIDSVPLTSADIGAATDATAGTAADKAAVTVDRTQSRDPVKVNAGIITCCVLSFIYD